MLCHLLVVPFVILSALGASSKEEAAAATAATKDQNKRGRDEQSSNRNDASPTPDLSQSSSKRAKRNRLLLSTLGSR